MQTLFEEPRKSFKSSRPVIAYQDSQTDFQPSSRITPVPCCTEPVGASSLDSLHSCLHTNIMFAFFLVLLVVAVSSKEDTRTGICPLPKHTVCNSNVRKHTCVCAMAKSAETYAPEKTCNNVVNIVENEFEAVSVTFSLDDKADFLDEFPEERFRKDVADSLTVNKDNIVIFRMGCSEDNEEFVVQFGVLDEKSGPRKKFVKEVSGGKQIKANSNEDADDDDEDEDGADDDDSKTKENQKESEKTDHDDDEEDDEDNTPQKDSGDADDDGDKDDDEKDEDDNDDEKSEENTKGSEHQKNKKEADDDNDDDDEEKDNESDEDVTQDDDEDDDENDDDDKNDISDSVLYGKKDFVAPSKVLDLISSKDQLADLHVTFQKVSQLIAIEAETSNTLLMILGALSGAFVVLTCICGFFVACRKSSGYQDDLQKV
ncbi:hypothetical protein QR680_002049 [Steinernema hermaphroditum]|uniref:Uncharacterized protein n=1 Tax=Steinernema hermaphroditum TaxID=289476 RepID=A0AA39H115_9BILA|nr:hypothetical protein QR680_002049 [Steinernema hermaphroditum]